jgi:hypothetical protein
MITLAFHNPEGALLCRLVMRDRTEESAIVPSMLRRMQAQMGWDGTKPGHNFCTQPLAGSGHKRQVMYYIDGQPVGWYVYHAAEVQTSVAAPVHRSPSQFRQWLHRCQSRARRCQEWLLAAKKRRDR